jgi:hypothetical protein
MYLKRSITNFNMCAKQLEMGVNGYSIYTVMLEAASVKYFINAINNDRATTKKKSLPDRMAERVPSSLARVTRNLCSEVGSKLRNAVQGSSMMPFTNRASYSFWTDLPPISFVVPGNQTGVLILPAEECDCVSLSSPVITHCQSGSGMGCPATPARQLAGSSPAIRTTASCPPGTIWGWAERTASPVS